MTAPHPADSELSDYAIQALPAGDHARIAAHLEACPRCTATVRAFTARTRPTGPPPRRTSRPPPDSGPADPPPAPPDDPLIGQMLGEYRVIHRLGQGGMGALYRGEQPVIGKLVAIKVLLQTIVADPTAVQRMLREAQAVNAIRHPNIVDIFSFGQLPDGRPYMVMELLEGRSLAEVLAEKGRLTAAQTAVVLAQSMAALEAVHFAGVIHRDLKPDNIYVDERPEGWNLTLLDFGLAKRPGSKSKGLTQPGMVVGTPGYMAPEQVRGDRRISAKTDIYAMGVLAWTLLVGREPFQGGSIVEIMHRHLKMPAPSPSAEVEGISLGLEALVMQMLEKNSARRPSAAEVRIALDRLSQDPAPLPRASTAAAAAWVVIGILGFSLVGVGWWVNSSGAQPEVAADLGSARPVAPPAVVAPMRVEPTPIPEAPLPPPVPTEPNTQISWSCSSITEVGEVTEVIGGRWNVFHITIENEPAVLVTTVHTRAGLRNLKLLHKEIKACRTTRNTLVAAHTDSQKKLFTTAGYFAGISVEVGNLKVLKARSH